MYTRNVLFSLALVCSLIAGAYAPSVAYAQEVETLALTRQASTLEELMTYLDEFVDATDDMTIQIAEGFYITEAIEIAPNVNGHMLILTSASGDSAQTLTRDVNNENDLFKLEEGVKAVFTNIIISGNKQNIDESEAWGTLVLVDAGAELTIEEGAEFRDNRASAAAGAIHCKGRLIMHGGIVAGNMVARTHDTYGGGVYIDGADSSLYFDGGMIGGYTEECANEAVQGGGLCIITEIDDTREDAFIITGNAQIIGNRAGWDYDEDEEYVKVFGKGGGVYHQGGTLLMTGGTIARNCALGPTSAGGGVENYYGKFVFTGGVIGGDSIEDANVAGKGGGICSETTHMDALELGGNARITYNIAGREINDMEFDGFGGGVLLANQSSCIVSSVTIAHNEARGQNHRGDGIYVMHDFTLYLKGAPSLIGNSIYTEDTLANSLVLLENLTGGSLIIKGSSEEGQMKEGVVVARSSEPGILELGLQAAGNQAALPSAQGFTVNSTSASAFRSADGLLVGAAQGDTVVWAAAHKPQPVIPPTGDANRVALITLLGMLVMGLGLACGAGMRYKCSTRQ